MPHSKPDIPLSLTKLITRCYAERKDGVWQAFALEFDLAAQADSWIEVKQKLESMIGSYVYDALAGEDRKHARDLLFHRRAPLSLWFKYYLARAQREVGVKRKLSRPYRESLPLIPQACAG